MPEAEQPSSIHETLGSLGAVLVRRRWCILPPFCGVALATIGVLSIIPSRYTSTATLLVVQQQVPQRYVVPNSTTDVTSALQAMKQEVLSRTQLLRMINEFGLYPRQRRRLVPEELVSLMLSSIDITPIEDAARRGKDKDIDAFRISFSTENAVLAQRVTNALTSLFINEYLRNGAEQASNTTSFLHQQVEEKGQALAEQEQRLRDFKLQHVGELPEQQSGNLGILTGLQSQLQNTMASLNRAQQQHALLQAELQAAPRRWPSDGSAATWTGNPGSTPVPSPLDAARGEVARLQVAQSALISKGYTAQHPDMQRNRRELAAAEDVVKRLASVPRPGDAGRSPAPVSPPSSAAEDPGIVQLKASLEANRLDIENLTRDEKRLKASIAEYEGRINETPIREQQQGAIVRDTEVLRQQYAELQKKEQESQLATNLERQQGGQQFRLIDPASLPSLPSSPNRRQILLGGAAGGLCLGLALALMKELLDTSYRTENQVMKHLAAPFVLGVPDLPTNTEEGRRRRYRALQWVTAVAMLVVVTAAEFYALNAR